MATGEAPDWAALFEEARLDMAAFARQDPGESARSAWTGPSPADPAVELRVEAIAAAGRVVHFAIVAPWTVAAEDLPQASPVPIQMLFVSVLILAVILARRNLARGRVDRRGARRVAVFAAGALRAAQIIEAPHVLAAAEIGIGIGIGILSWSVFVAAVTWLLYVALEPQVRRLWPRALVTWVRLVGGGWRDRLVGRDLLVGSVLGLASGLLEVAASVVGDWRAGVDFIWTLDVNALRGIDTALAAVLHVLSVSATLPLMLVCLLLLLRLVSPRPWVAPLLAVGIMTVPSGPFIDPAVQVPVTAIAISMPVLPILRLGVLACASYLFVAILSAQVMVSLDLTPFFATNMLVGIVALVTPALIGFYASVRGRDVVAGRLG